MIVLLIHQTDQCTAYQTLSRICRISSLGRSFPHIFDQIHITTHRLTPDPDAIKVIRACSQLGNRLLPRVDQLVDAARETSHLEKKELLAQVKVRNLICYNYKILTDHKPHPQSPLSQAARRSWQTSSHPSPCSRANPS